MTIPNGPRLDASQPAITTLAAVLERVRECPALSARQRQEMASALRTAGRVCARPLSQLPTSTRALRHVFKGVAPIRYGLSGRRWTNVRSLVHKAIAHACGWPNGRRSKAPLCPSWLALLHPLPKRPFQIALTPFARYCSQRGLSAAAVDQGVMEAYGQHLENTSACRRPRQTYLSVVRAWNSAGAVHCRWPGFRARVHHRYDHYAVAWSDLPATLKADVDAMCRDAISPNLFRPTSRAPIKPISAENRVKLLRTFASALVRSGCDPAELRSIADLVRLDRVEVGLTFIYQRLGERKTVHLHQIAKLLCTLAKYWVRVPKTDLDGLVAIRRQVDPRAYGMTAKNRATLRTFEDPRVIDTFLSLPDRVWKRHGKELAHVKTSAAVKLQSALAIEILTFAPLRCKNLVTLRLDQNIVAHGAGRGRRVHLHIPATDVKNGVVLEFQLQPSTVRLLDAYLEHVQPRLSLAPSPFLFPGRGAGPKGAARLSEQIAEMVEQEVGVRVTVHQFRHLAGFLYLKAHPGGHEVVRRLLGHKSIETTLRFYAGMEVTEALRHFDAHVRARREDIVALPRRRARRRADG